MQKKSIFTILGIMLAVVVASLSFVFAVGPRVSADSEVVLNQESHFKINDSHQLTGISDEGKSLINGKNFRVEIPSSVTSIGSKAFYRCSVLTTVTFAGNSQLTNIGLTSIEIPSSVTSIGGWAFSDCYGLTTVTFAENSQLTSIGNDAFWGCSGLTSMEIPSSVTSIGYDAFYCCSGLTSIEIPSSVTSIGISAFSGCSGLTTVTFAGNSQLTSIGEWAFDGCRGLTSIEIPSSVTSISDGAFYECSGLTSIEIPSSVTSIGWNAFDGCRGLTSIEIPSSVTSIGYCAFDGCSGLTHIRCEASKKPDGWSDSWLGDCNPEIVKYGYVAPQDTNNQETSNTVTENNKFNPVIAWVGGGIAATLSLIAVAGIVVAKKRRK